MKKYIELKESIVKKLTLDFNIPLNDTIRDSFIDGGPLGNRPPKNILTRYPWTDIDDKYYQGVNLSININPDPSKINDYNNKKLLNNILLHYINNEVKIQKAIGVYEYGSKGAHYGKLHYHIAIKTNYRKDIEDKLIEMFNQRSNCKHRTLQSKPFKDVKHRTDYINYMKKETQNKIKCLFIKNL